MAWVLDLDGVVWLADVPIAGAAGAVDALRVAGHDVVFVTNNSNSTLAAYEAKLAAQGIDGGGDVITSSMAAAGLIEPGERVLVCAGPGVWEAVEARGAEPVAGGEADVVVVGFHREFDYERLAVASAAVRGGARLIGTNDDATFPTPSGLLPGNGSLLAAVATAGGATPVVAGKPYPPMAALVRERCGPAGTFVGDRLDTDGRLARELGYRFVLVLSGVTGPDVDPLDPEPDLVVADLAEAVASAGPGAGAGAREADDDPSRP